MDSNGNTLKSYGYRPGSPWGTDPLFMRENGKNYWYLNDHLGTPQQIVAENGGVVWKAQYAAFGKAEVSSDATVSNNLRFPGQYYDEETGLHYNWNRYYDPESGRYTQVDPIGFEGEINIYVYTFNNAIKYIDNLGLKGIETCINMDICIKKCIDENYGELYSLAKDLNPLSIVSIITGEVSDEISNSLKRNANINLHKNYKVGRRQILTWKQFKLFSKSVSVIGAAALGFQVGAYNYCYISCLGSEK